MAMATKQMAAAAVEVDSYYFERLIAFGIAEVVRNHQDLTMFPLAMMSGRLAVVDCIRRMMAVVALCAAD